MASLLEKIVDERVGQTLVGGISMAAEKIAEEIAREALQDEKFRSVLKEIVRRRSEELLDELLRNGGTRRRPRGRKRAR